MLPEPPSQFRSQGVLCLGSIVLDILVRPVEGLAWGQTTWVESIQEHLGGNGANTSYTLARLGVPARLLGVVGCDSFGDYARARLGGAGVDVSRVGRLERATATSVALVNSRGERMFLHRPGVSTEAFPEPVEFPVRLLDGVSHFHLGNPFALPRFRPHAAETLRRARAAGLTTSLDTAWDSLGRWLADIGPCLPHTDLLFVNGDEARMLTGLPDPAGAARELRRLGARTVVVKLGPQGCAVFGQDAEVTAPAFAVPVVDTTGAGDCFAGAYLAARLRGCSEAGCARFANAAASLTIQQLGATEGLRSYQETEAWMVEAPAAR